MDSFEDFFFQLRKNLQENLSNELHCLSKIRVKKEKGVQFNSFDD